MEPMAALSNKDKEGIIQYCKLYGKSNLIDVDNFLYHWSENKRTLYKALGYNLRKEFPIKIQMEQKVFYMGLHDIYNPVSLSSYIENTRSKDYKNEFINDFFFYIEHLQDTGRIPKDNNHSLAILRLFCYKTIYNKTIDFTNTFIYQDKQMTLKQGTKTIKAISKLLKFFNYRNIEAFERWRNKISDLQTKQYINQTLVLSIHPIDYMTMSDNTNNWSSCMSWKDDGCYSKGTLEMMNSNMVVVAYLKSDSPFIVGNYSIPNKSWRMLLYVHKKIIATGKAYPFSNLKLSQKALTFMRSLVEANLHWRYQYLNQKYLDLIHYYDSEEIHTYKKYEKNTDRKAILIYTEAMYNDLVADHKEVYLCCRNYVNKTLYLNASGPIRCISCGNKIISWYDDSDNGSDKTCSTCRSNYYCDMCNKTDITAHKFYIKFYENSGFNIKKNFCERCAEKYLLYSKKFNLFVEKNGLLDNFKYIYYIDENYRENVFNIMSKYYAPGSNYSSDTWTNREMLAQIKEEVKAEHFKYWKVPSIICHLHEDLSIPLKRTNLYHYSYNYLYETTTPEFSFDLKDFINSFYSVKECGGIYAIMQSLCPES